VIGPSLHRPSGSLAGDGEELHLGPEAAGWDYCGLRVLALPRASARALATAGDEVVLLPLSGSFDVAAGPFTCHLHGRSSVFTGVTDFAYLPPGTDYEVTSDEGGTLAVASARVATGRPPAYGRAEDVPVEVRGAGCSTRQVNNFMAPDAFAAEKLMAVEVLTPSGNWSSYPPHKHDEDRAGEAQLEEIYYFRFRGTPEAGAQAAAEQAAFGLQTVYRDGQIFCAMVQQGDVVLVPRGYHGPSAAAPGYDMYYLNVLAGPGSERSMAFCDDPAHTWVRTTWSSQPQDPRVPLYGAPGPPAHGENG
jgi:5-deoxy-glucuronate isomerase